MAHTAQRPRLRKSARIPAALLLAASLLTGAATAAELTESPPRPRDVLAGVESARLHHPYVVVIDPGHGGKLRGCQIRQ